MVVVAVVVVVVSGCAARLISFREQGDISLSSDAGHTLYQPYVWK